MTTITLNGRPADVDDGTTLEGLLERLDLPARGRGVAVAVDAEVVPRGQWPHRVVADGEQVEVVTAVQGG
jgi:sulfur carrier protein